MKAVLVCGIALIGAWCDLPAQGLPFHTHSALTTAFEARGVRIFSTVQRRRGVTAVSVPLVVLPFAPHERVTSTIALPVLYKRESAGAGGAFTNLGLGDLALSVKWAFLVRNRPGGTTRLAAILSASLPTGPTDAVREDGTPAVRPLQLGRGSATMGGAVAATLLCGRWGLSADVGHTRSGRDDAFLPGPVTRYNLAIGFRIPDRVASIRTRTLQVYLEWNGQVTGRASLGNAELPDTGGHITYVSPGVQWVVLPQLLLEASVQLPIRQRSNGIQPGFGIRPAVGLRVLFV